MNKGKPLTQQSKVEIAMQAFSKTSQLLKNITTSSHVDDVSVKITAEPTVIDIKIPQETDISTLSEKLKECLNKAFRKSTKQVISQALDEIKQE